MNEENTNLMQDNNIKTFGTHKTYPIELEIVILKALSFYPALKKVKIDFVFNENIRKHVMQALPRYASMFGRRRNRSYIISMSNCFVLKGTRIPLHDLPEDVLVGWIGHELGHIMDYLRRSNWSLILFGIGYYTSRTFIIAAERVADTYAINQGLGEYILTTKDFILHQAGMSEQYIKKIRRFYVPPEEVMLMMEQTPLVDD
jgi:hypothetical protein